MKILLFSISIFFACSFKIHAQEENDRTMKQPPPITQAQVEKDAALAKQERKKHEKEKNALKEEKQKVEDKNVNSDLEPTPSTRKTSKQPGKQQ